VSKRLHQAFGLVLLGCLIGLVGYAGWQAAKGDWSGVEIVGLVLLSGLYSSWSMRVERHHEYEALANSWRAEGLWVCLRLRKKRIVGLSAHPYPHALAVREAGEITPIRHIPDEIVMTRR
jgi:hypothetical protein